jgi:hypothetical protein
MRWQNRNDEFPRWAIQGLSARRLSCAAEHERRRAKKPDTEVKNSQRLFGKYVITHIGEK